MLESQRIVHNWSLIVCTVLCDTSEKTFEINSKGGGGGGTMSGLEYRVDR